MTGCKPKVKDSRTTFRSIQTTLKLNGVDFDVEDAVYEVFKEYSKASLSCVDVTNKVCKMVGALNVKEVNNKATKGIIRTAIINLENKGLVVKTNKGYWKLNTEE